MIHLFNGVDQNIARHFQFDYILFDSVFLVLFIAFMVWRKRHAPLIAGLCCGLIIYVIDGVIWYSLGIREYTIFAPWVKHAVDFMMDFSYGVVAFGWMWIAFERKSLKDVGSWTLLVLMGWFLVPLASAVFSLQDEAIMTVRHMQSQVGLQIGMVVVGYLLLFLLRYRFRSIAYLFGVGCMLGFMMEIPLNAFGIRPTSLGLLVYETLFLFNAGVPYLFLIWHRMLPSGNAHAFFKTHP